ncbi:hypothetical protein EXU85_21170 [Spirosoma sp. KCTC 42546]|uniref:hypothetical protein n=1 Tax=Spirosoma sp. KCTC 42546 TaxID=2520506 RepID=UPI0011580CF0|nr:hypothetical protein [Spirosoma sp. KCTC 42546]QDK80988.1 hypothetical protein EXU85_21170 [Spirosoma sp. KCTC 42546]
MKNGIQFLCLLVGIWACSKSNNDSAISPDGVDGPKNAIALLNDEDWYGRGTASKVVAISGDTCRINRFNVYISNELPYPKGARKAAPYNCIGPCDQTQYLSFEKVPLAIGKYDAVRLTSCTPAPITGVSYGLIIGGDVVFTAYRAQGANSGWIEVTRADTVANVIEGKFELTLTSQEAKTVQFRNGSFTLPLQK